MYPIVMSKVVKCQNISLVTEFGQKDIEQWSKDIKGWKNQEAVKMASDILADPYDDDQITMSVVDGDGSLVAIAAYLLETPSQSLVGLKFVLNTTPPYLLDRLKSHGSIYLNRLGGNGSGGARLILATLMGLSHSTSRPIVLLAGDTIAATDFYPKFGFVPIGTSLNYYYI